MLKYLRLLTPSLLVCNLSSLQRYLGCLDKREENKKEERWKRIREMEKDNLEKSSFPLKIVTPIQMILIDFVCVFSSTGNCWNSHTKT